MTVAEMRLVLGLGIGFSDAYVANAYAEYQQAGGGDGSDVELIPLTLVKRHLKVELEDTDEDDLIAAYLEAAIAAIDGPFGRLGCAIVERTYVRTFDSFDCLTRLPYPPVVAVTGIEQWLGTGVWVPIDAAFWDFADERLTTIGGYRWPRGAARVTYQAGYDPDAGRPLPKSIQAAILLMVGDLYRNRGEVVIGAPAARAPMSAAVDSLLAPFKVWRV